MKQYSSLATGSKNHCCYRCTERTPHCHGRNEDGTYRCEKWEKQVAADEARRKKDAEAVDYKSYRFDLKVRTEKEQKRHKGRRR